MLRYFHMFILILVVGIWSDFCFANSSQKSRVPLNPVTTAQLQRSFLQKYNEAPVAMRWQLGAAVVGLKTKQGAEGNGFLFLYDGSLRILTNLHIIQSDSGGTQTSSARTEILVHSSLLTQPVFAELDASFANRDIAVLKLQEPWGSSPELIQMAAESLQICSGANGPLCFPRASVCNPNQNKEGADEAVLFKPLFSNSVTTVRAPLYSGVFAKCIADEYIGFYEHIWRVPMVLRRGVSGGAFYRDGLIAGLLTKVTMTMDPVSFAIPIEEIASMLIRRPSVQEARMIMGRGGDVGDGSGSWDAGDDDDWILDPGCLGCSHFVKVASPFFTVMRDPSLLLDGKQIAILKQNAWSGALYQLATAARMQFLNSQQQKPELLSYHQQVVEQLHKERVGTPFNLELVRVWNVQSPGDLQNAHPGIGFANSGVCRFFTKPGSSIALLSPDRPIFGTAGNRSWVNLLFSTDDIGFEVSSDLNSLLLWQPSLSGSVQLRRILTPNPARILFQASADKVGQVPRVLFVYSEANLKQLEKIIVETPQKVIEISRTHPIYGTVWK